MFTLPLHSYHKSARFKSINVNPRKRKRKDPRPPEQGRLQDAQVTDSHSESLGSPPPSQWPRVSALLTPDEIYQYAVAGQSLENGLQGYPFPHADSANRDGPSRFEYGLRQELNRDLALDPGRDSLPFVGSLHQQHLAVMTTILHRSLLEQDFVRAGRALAMILRDEVAGRAVDIRAEGRWGFGAEILIRQDAQREHRSRELFSSSSVEQDRVLEQPLLWFTRKGFEDAKRYYERLIVQYPFYKQNPGAVNALDFYPAMFGLWICVVHQEARLKSLGSKSGDDSDVSSAHHQEVVRAPGHLGGAIASQRNR